MPDSKNIHIPYNVSGHKYVALKCLGLTDIDQFSFEGVVHLNLSRNRIRSLNNETLTSVEVLDISDNQIETLPASICSLPKLKRIDLGFTWEPTIPPDCLCESGNLEVFNVDLLDIGALPILSKCRKLRNLSIIVGDDALDEKELEMLSGMEALENLKLVLVNKIAPIPVALTNRIKTLSVVPSEDQHLPEILNEISKIKVLETLEITIEGKQLSVELPQFDNLKTLIVRRSSGNTRVTLPESIKQIPTLESIYEFENIKGLSKSITVLSRYESANKYEKMGYKRKEFTYPSKIK